MDAPDVFHAGELRAQEMAGVREKMQRIGGAFIRDHMPDQHREFFPLLPMLLLGGRDDAGQVWATTVWGEPGFVQSPDPVTLRVAARTTADDPLRLHEGMQIGALGLQFETRRRNRANGVVSRCDDEGVTLAVRQSFGNCPKYIQARDMLAASADAPGPVSSGTNAPPPAAQALIVGSDTFFIASAAAHGADVSHRGGLPGFVKMEDDGSLCWPDFQGNNFFNTIGNLLADARAGLLFIGFESGDLLHLSGRAAPRVEADGRRMLHFVPEKWIWRPVAMPWRWRLREVSPHLAPAQ